MSGAHSLSRRASDPLKLSTVVNCLEGAEK